MAISASFVDRVEDAVARKDIAALDHMAETYFEAAPQGPTPFSAAVRLNAAGQRAVYGDRREGPELAESAMALDAANYVERSRRYVTYELKKFAQPNAVRIVAEGDSWFEYPFLLDDVIDCLMEKYAVRCLSAGGDTVSNMVRMAEYLDAIATEKPAAFVFSGGGNDLVGDGRMRIMLRHFAAGADARSLIDWDAFQDVLAGVIAGYTTMLGAVRREFPALKVLAHAYDHPCNIGVGPWIKPYLDEKQIPLEMGKKIVAVMLDEFGRKLVGLQPSFPNFSVVSVIGLVGPNATDWYDALHPNNPGFRRVANAFAARIEQVRAPAPLREAAAFAERMESAEAAGWVHTSGEGTRALIKKTFTLPNFAYPVWGDFGPEGDWIKFDDPAAAGHIRDVISLLEERHTPIDPDLLDNRMRLRPKAIIGQTDVPTAEGNEELAEAIIGGNDLEDVQVLLVGYQASRSIGLVARASNSGMRIPRGTGSLVGPGLLLTNHHVLPAADDALQHILILDDERDLTGANKPSVRFRITGDLYLSDPDLDFTFVSVEPVNANGVAIAPYGRIELFAQPGKAIAGEPLSIIQHAGGQPKTVAIRNSYAMGRVNEGFYYTADTLNGSSGSAVMNREWQMVALHHRSVPHPKIKGQFIANRGIRISSLMERLSTLRGKGNAAARRVLELLDAPLPAQAPPDPFSKRSGAEADEIEKVQKQESDAVAPAKSKPGNPVNGATSQAEIAQIKGRAPAKKQAVKSPPAKKPSRKQKRV